MINVSALHQHASAFGSRGQNALARMNGKKKKKGEGDEPQKSAVTTKRPVLDPEIFTPDPVAAKRRQEFGDAAQRLADWADSRTDEIRAKRAPKGTTPNGGK